MDLGDRGLSVGDGQCKDGRLGGNEHPQRRMKRGRLFERGSQKKSNVSDAH
jgi:hypothetical protein